MTDEELLRRCKFAESNYRRELSKICDEYYSSNLKFRIGDVIEFKNYVNSGYITVERLFIKNLKEYMADPYENRPAIVVEGRKLNSDGKFQRIFSNYATTQCWASDFVKIINIHPHD